MMGFLYAYTAYQSPFKRIICAVVALILPILANWLRALLIVLIAHASDNKLGTGIDHLFLGWVLFGIIILSAFWLGRRWGTKIPSPRADRASLAALRQAPACWPWPSASRR